MVRCSATPWVPAFTVASMSRPASLNWPALSEYLSNQQGDRRLTFQEIEGICGGALPASKQYPAFWSNSSTYARYWAAAGYSVSRAGCGPEEVRFIAGDPTPLMRPLTAEAGTAPMLPTAKRDDERHEGARIVLIGCVKTKRPTPAPAADLYISPLFDRRRAYAEDSDAPWFILSAEYGLLAPGEVVSPYDTYLADMSGDYRRTWGDWCATRLAHLAGPLTGKTIEIHAGATYVDSVRVQLEAWGAIVEAPLAGLAQGQQLAWYPTPDPTRPRWTEPARQLTASTTSGVSRDARAVADALLDYRARHLEAGIAIPLSDNPEADRFLRGDPFAFLIAVIFDEGIDAERAWAAPLELSKRLGHFNPAVMRHQSAEVAAAIKQAPAMHRYMALIPEAVCLAAARVCDVYGGDAGAIWADGLSVLEVDRRLQEFKRIGQKKAAMSVEILLSQFGHRYTDLDRTDIAYDVQVRRVFLRAGIVEWDSPDAMIAAARRLHPERPGYLDLPVWQIGREWCRPTNPLCGTCPLTNACPKRVDRAH